MTALRVPASKTRSRRALVALVSTAVAAIAVAVLGPVRAGAVANAVVPTTTSPGTSTTTITSYQQTDFPANDDETFPGSEPDGSSPLGFDLNFYGTKYSSAFVNNNGNITFDNPLSTYTPFGLTGTQRVIIAAFFADVDTRADGSALVNFGQGMLGGHKVFVVNWPGVGCFDEIGTALNHFQMIITDRSDRGTGALGDDFDIEFNYNTIVWDAGQASGSDAQCLNSPDENAAAVGFSNGSTSAFELQGSQVSGGLLDSNAATGLINHSMNSSTLGRYIFTVHGGQPDAPQLVCGIPVDAPGTSASAARAVQPQKAVPVGTTIAELTGDDGDGGDTFGAAVAVSGATAVVGAPTRAVNSNPGQGTVYVFVRKGKTWAQTAEITAADGAAGDAFGTSVAIKGASIVVGSPQHTAGGHTKQGAVYVFGKKKNAWTQTAELTSTDGGANDRFGCSVATSGSTVVVGALGHNANKGAAYVFHRKGPSWQQSGALAATDGAAGDLFGRSVALAGSTVVVGAFEHSAGRGAAYVFGKTKNAWTQSAELTAADGASGDWFGWSLTASGTTVVIGASEHKVGSSAGQGAAYIFARKGKVWSQASELTASNGQAGDLFGYSVAVSGPRMLIGAPGHSAGSNLQQGAAYVFERKGKTWSLVAQPAASDAAAGDAFGSAVAVQGKTALIGSPGKNVTTSAHEQGTAYLIEA